MKFRHKILRAVMLAGLVVFATPHAALAQPGGQHTLNLKDSDIRALIATVSEITGKNFIIDPQVQGKVNVVSSKPMGPDEVYAVFESILRVHGYAAVKSGDMIKIIPEAMAQSDGQIGGGEVGPDTLVTRVIELKHVAAAELVQILRPLMPQQGNIIHRPGSNTLIISDRAGNIARLESIIRRVDTASDAAVEVIPMQNANASEVARTLSLLNDDKTAGSSNEGKVFADARTNSLLLSGSPSARLRFKTLITHLDTPLESGESTQVVYVRYAKASELAPILEGVAASITGNKQIEGSKAAMIQSHAETNALVITADPAVFRALSAVIRQLDIRRAQVLIEGVVAELSDDMAKDVGVQWQTTNIETDADGNIQRGMIGGTNFSRRDGTGSIVGAMTNPLTAGAGLNLGYIGGTINIPGTDTPLLQIGALVSALSGDGRSNILSTPSITTLDHSEATIKVGQEVPFLTGQYTNTGGQNGGGGSQPTNPFQTIDRNDVGLSLVVTPHINEGDTVRLDIAQEVSSLAPSAGAVDLITNKREIKTSVMVPDGGMLVLGGLISDEVQKNVSKVPGLGDIPVIGNLFRYRSNKRMRRNLMVFLKPTILRDAATEAAVSNDKYNFIRQQQIQAAGDATIQKAPSPVLPELAPRSEKPIEQTPQ